MGGHNCEMISTSREGFEWNGLADWLADWFAGWLIDCVLYVVCCMLLLNTNMHLNLYFTP